MAIYLLHGDSKSTDPNQVRSRLEQLLKDVDRQGNLNFAEFDLASSGTKFEDVVESAMTVPFLGGQRAVVAKGMKSVERFFKKPEKDEEEESDEDLSGSAESILRAVEQLKELPEDALLIFVEENHHLDGRTSFYKALKRVGCHFETFKAMWFDPASGDVRTVVQYIQTEASRHKIRMDAKAAERFAYLVGWETGNIGRELEKLALYAGPGASPTVEDVENVVTKAYEAIIWHLVDLIGLGNVGQALDVLGDLLDHGAAPPYILAMIARQLRLIAMTREALDEGVPPRQDDIAKELSISPFQARKFLRQARSFRPFSYPEVLEWLMETDMHLKTGTMNEKLALETLIMRLGYREPGPVSPFEPSVRTRYHRRGRQA